MKCVPSDFSLLPRSFFVEEKRHYNTRRLKRLYRFHGKVENDMVEK